MRGLGGSSSIKASRMEEGERERALGVCAGGTPEAPSPPFPFDPVGDPSRPKALEAPV